MLSPRPRRCATAAASVRLRTSSLARIRDTCIHIRWNLRVGGKRLKPGTYQVKVRALRHGKVVAVSKPIRIRIRR
jgi:hypothetical protein